jgi:hypothetical protein
VVKGKHVQRGRTGEAQCVAGAAGRRWIDRSARKAIARQTYFAEFDTPVAFRATAQAATTQRNHQ